MSEAIEKVSIVLSKGSLEGIYPGLIMANGTRMEGIEGIEANLFFTFFGHDARQLTRRLWRGYLPPQGISRYVSSE
ncbi:MAG: peroxiredoxin family protein [Glaciecola sp.]|jgi:peroxiredoxin family protein|uniref:DsrE/DsrF/DrsH-like family protein n=1 Tax=Congregibacter sp. TaxID=2744308 RepID=UPI0039E4D701